MNKLFNKVRVNRFRNNLFASPLYRFLLNRSAPCTPGKIEIAFEGNKQRGQSLRLGDDILSGHTHRSNRFDWLADIQASDLDTSVAIAQELTEKWLEAHSDWNPESWRLDVLAARICNWIPAAHFVLAGADPDFSHAFTGALARHINHLKIAIYTGEPLPMAFTGQKALIYCGVALPDQAGLKTMGLDLLERAIHNELSPDGGHKLRTPSAQLTGLRNLIDVRSVLQAGPQEIPGWIDSAIDHMTPVLRTYVLGDGQLANFNGTELVAAPDIASVLDQASPSLRALNDAPDVGFQRLAARRTVVLMDTGVTEHEATDSLESAGTLSFEMTVGKQRLVVNCGQKEVASEALKKALRGTSAHSTLEVAETNSSKISTYGTLGPRRAWRSHLTRREIEKNTLVEAAHTGYQEPFGLTHKRSLFLAASGQELRGEDKIEGSADHPVCLRFHLHPSVHASLVGSGDSVLLKFGKSAGWRFRTSVATLHLEPSLYLEGGAQRQTTQIVLTHAHTGPESQVKWRFSLEG